MIDFDKSKKNILELIKIRFDNYGRSFKFGMSSKDIEFCEVEKNICYDIVFSLEKQGFIENLAITDLDGGLETEDGWMPWFMLDEALLPGIYTFNISENFDSLYKKMFKIPEDKSKKTNIFVDKINGVYKNEKYKDPCYLLKEDTKRFKILKHLNKSEALSSAALTKIVSQSYSNLNKAIKEINKNFRTELLLKNDLVVKVKNGLYLLNKDKYNIIFK